MTANVGTADRALRVVLGVALIAAALVSGWAFFDSAAVMYGAVAVGAVLLATAAFRFCPLYTLFGLKTCRS